VYFEPPPLPGPFYGKTDAEVLAWLDTQPPAYQETARTLAAEAGVPVADHERRRGTVACAECGYDGTPTKAHRWNCPIGIVKGPLPRSVMRAEAAAKFADDQQLKDDDDDDLPF
jgi:hypothetical protein